jgi:hypothetical protein
MKEKETHEMTLPLERFRMLVGGSLSSGIPRSCKLCNQIISADEAFGNEREIVREPASIPPSSGRTLVIPLARSSSATRALVASLGHEQ